MKYMGSKNRIAKYILPIMLAERKPDQYYVEPFAGGFNTIDKVAGNRIASDSHYYLIELFKAVQGGWVPPENVSNEEYRHIWKNPNDYPACLVGFVGFGCSYSGRYFEGYARGNDNNGNPRNYAAESRRNILKQVPGLQRIEIHHADYRELSIPDNSIMYCDPPYQGTKWYSTSVKGFNHVVFWQWCRDMASKGHTIFVSEYNAPDDFECVWQKEIVSSLTKDTGSKKGIEKLFRYKHENL